MTCCLPYKWGLAPCSPNPHCSHTPWLGPPSFGFKAALGVACCSLLSSLRLRHTVWGCEEATR